MSNRQTVFFLPVDPADKNHKDLDVIDLNVPRRAQYLHKARKRHQDAVYWVDINLAIEKALKFYLTRSNAIIFQETLPAYCIPKVARMETGEVIYEKVYMSLRNTNGKENWVQNMLNDQKLGNYLGVSNRTAQFQIQVVRERRDPLLKLTREPCKMKEKRPVLRRSMLILFTKKLFLRKERGDPLLKQTQKMCQIVVKHVLFMKAKHSTLEIKHFVKER